MRVVNAVKQARGTSGRVYDTTELNTQSNRFDRNGNGNGAYLNPNYIGGRVNNSPSRKSENNSIHHAQ